MQDARLLLLLLLLLSQTPVRAARPYLPPLGSPLEATNCATNYPVCGKKLRATGASPAEEQGYSRALHCFADRLPPHSIGKPGLFGLWNDGLGTEIDLEQGSTECFTLEAELWLGLYEEG